MVSTGRAPILVVEDDADIRDLVVFILTSEGYEVHGAENGAEALRWLQSGHQPCLIFLDLMMPVMDGWRFVEVARSQGLLRAPVVVLSAAQNARAEAQKLGTSGCLRKPLDVEDVLHEAARLCSPAHRVRPSVTGV